MSALASLPGAWVAIWIAVALLVVIAIGIVTLLLRRPDDATTADALLDATREQALVLERGLRDQLEASARANRRELAEQLARMQQGLLAQSGDALRTQNEQIDAFRLQLAAMQQQLAQSLAGSAETLATQLDRFSQAQATQLATLGEAQAQRLAEVRSGVETRLAALQEGNERRLEQMRATVDEKLQATLEQRLGESFRQVAERLEQVHRGLGEMQGLARDVGSLNRVLSNVKTRGTFGEVQLGALLEQVFTGEQIGRNVETVPGSGARVEFALQAARRTGARRRARRRGRRPGDRDAPAPGGPDDPREVPGPAAHHRVRDPVRADRGPVCRGPAPPGPGGVAAA